MIVFTKQVKILFVNHSFPLSSVSANSPCGCCRECLAHCSASQWGLMLLFICWPTKEAHFVKSSSQEVSSVLLQQMTDRSERSDVIACEITFRCCEAGGGHADRGKAVRRRLVRLRGGFNIRDIVPGGRDFPSVSGDRVIAPSCSPSRLEAGVLTSFSWNDELPFNFLPNQKPDLKQVYQSACGGHPKHKEKKDGFLDGSRHVALHHENARVVVAPEPRRNLEPVQEELEKQTSESWSFIVSSEWVARFTCSGRKVEQDRTFALNWQW